MTWGAVAASALTAVLTLSGGLVLLRVQTITKAAEERRAARRQWHDEAVDVIVDVASLIQDAGLLALGLPLRSAGGQADSDEEWIELQERWRTALRRRVQRIARGHPDSLIRTEADRIADAAVRALRIALDNSNPGGPKYSSEEILEIFDLELMPMARSYVRCLHGEDKTEAEGYASTLRRTYDIYLETGVVLKPAEISG